MAKIPTDAFDFYFSLGPGRSYQAVADKVGVSKRAVTKCADREGWQARLHDLERKARERSDDKIVESIDAMNSRHLPGVCFRPVFFEPTFHKHAHQLCHGIHIHAEGRGYDHAAFRPWRLQALAFKAIRLHYPDYPLWRDFPYEYAFGRLPIDVINGGPGLREWVDDMASQPGDLDALAQPDEAQWLSARIPFQLY